jgi:hypothetical protein
MCFLALSFRDFTGKSAGQIWAKCENWCPNNIQTKMNICAVPYFPHSLIILHVCAHSDYLSILVSLHCGFQIDGHSPLKLNGPKSNRNFPPIKKRSRDLRRSRRFVSWKFGPLKPILYIASVKNRRGKLSSVWGGLLLFLTPQKAVMMRECLKDHAGGRKKRPPRCTRKKRPSLDLLPLCAGGEEYKIIIADCVARPRARKREMMVIAARRRGVGARVILNLKLRPGNK